MSKFSVPTRWSFDRTDVAEHFDTHVREQLPWYEWITSAVVQIARHYVTPGGRVYDLGASTGNIATALTPVLVERDAHVVGIESSPAMVERYDGPGTVVRADVVTYDYEPCDLAVAMLALMFLRPVDVPVLLDKLVAALTPGGALVIVDRTLPGAGYPHVVTSRLTLAAKAANGASGNSIVAKELSLAGVQRPLDRALLDARGAVEWFRFADFAGFIIEATS